MHDVSKPEPMGQFQQMAERLKLDDHGAAAYLGVPVNTYKKWALGQRKPSSSTRRLLEVLGIVEALAPSLHDALMPAPLVRRPRGRPRKQLMVENPVA